MAELCLITFAVIVGAGLVAVIANLALHLIGKAIAGAARRLGLRRRPAQS